MPAGAFVIGRGADCQLALDDAQVSRRHAVLRVDADGAVLEDLGSRNGVFLNGVRIEKSEPLHDGDQIRIGAQDLGFFASEGPASKPESSRRETIITTREEMQASQLRPHDPDDRSELTRAATGPMGGGAPRAPRAASDHRRRRRQGPRARPRRGGGAHPPARARRDPGARRGRRAGPGGAERPIDAELAERAAGYAVRLAAATGRGAWIDYVFQPLHGARRS